MAISSPDSMLLPRRTEP